MTTFNKTHWTADDQHIRMDVEFSKVNKEKRLVSGWATLDNLDTQNDIVLADASMRAFKRARGNLREMHKKDQAVGKIVSFKEDEFRTPDGAKHRGVFVTAYVSKGAQDTWEKVLDGTLSGFSIGGSIIDSEETFNKDANATARIIKEYDLTELSLVDNPGNQLANVFHIEKSADGSVTSITGMAADIEVLNVFFCDTDEIVLERNDEKVACPVCENLMTNIGWFENGPDRNEKVGELVQKYYNPETTDVIRKGGDEVAKKEETLETVETGHEEGDPLEVPTPAQPAEEVEKVVDSSEEEPTAVVDEVHDEEEQVLSKINELHEAVKDSLEKNRSDTQQTVKALEDKIDELTKSFTATTSEFEKKFEELDLNLETTKSKISGFAKSLEKINSQGAFRKSIDSDEPMVVKNNDTDDFWGGSAFSVDSLTQ